MNAFIVYEFIGDSAIIYSVPDKFLLKKLHINLKKVNR